MPPIRLAAATLLALAFFGKASGQTPAQPVEEVQTRFAPGILTLVPPSVDPKETFDGPMSLTAIVAEHPEIRWQGAEFPDGAPHFAPKSRTLEEMSKEITLRREVYCLEFAFKPLRQLLIDVPRPDGRLQKKIVHYMVYRVRYRGGDLRPAADNDDQPIYERIESVSYPFKRFFPLFKLVNHDTGVTHLDKVLPTVTDRIAQREKISARLHNSAEIAAVKIDLSREPDAKGVWGVATWSDVEPDLDFFTVEIYGLSNAFEQDGLEPDAPYRRKVLALHFFRPGDGVDQTEDLTRFGVPAYQDETEMQYILDKYGLDQRVDYRWVFR